MKMKGNIKSRAPGLGKQTFRPVFPMQTAQTRSGSCPAILPNDLLFAVTNPERPSLVQSCRATFNCLLYGASWKLTGEGKKNKEKKSPKTLTNTGVLKLQNNKKSTILSHTLLVFCSLLSLLFPAPSVVS